MPKALRAIVGKKPTPTPTSINIPMNPNRKEIKGDEDEWVKQNTSPATVVTNPEDDSSENFKSSLKKDDSEASPGRGLKMKLGEEQINELDKKTLKSYQRKATTQSDRLNKKIDDEEDRAMSTDGEKYLDKQNRHIANASAAHRKLLRRNKGLELVQKKLKK